MSLLLFYFFFFFFQAEDGIRDVAVTGVQTCALPILSTRMSRHVAHYTGQAELAQAIQDGLEARKAGDEDTAALRLGRAVVLAHESGNEDTANLLAKVVDVIDPATGTVRLKAKVADADEMALDTRSTKTVRVKK